MVIYVYSYWLQHLPYNDVIRSNADPAVDGCSTQVRNQTSLVADN